MQFCIVCGAEGAGDIQDENTICDACFEAMDEQEKMEALRAQAELQKK